MSTPLVNPPPGFQLEQSRPADIKPPAEFRLENPASAAVAAGTMFEPTVFHAGTGPYASGKKMLGQANYQPLSRSRYQPSRNPELEQSMQTMLRYEQRVGNLPKAKPQAPPKPPGPEHLSPQLVGQFTEKIANLPELQRGEAMAQAHQLMTGWMLDRSGKPFMGPDHKLHIVKNQAEAERLALELINDQVESQDRRQAESQKIFHGPQQANPVEVSSSNSPSAVDLQAKVQSFHHKTAPRATVPHVLTMGHNMTGNAPAVRKVQIQAKPVPGQVPKVKVKREPPRVQTALAQAPAPVSVEEASQIGQADSQSGRQILQPSNNLVQNERLAADSAPYLTTKLSKAAASVPGARFDRLRPQKGLRRLEEKVADGKPPSTIGDNLAAQIVANTIAAKDQLIARLRQQFPVISVDDKFLQPREKAGYPSTNLQLQMPNGGTAEVQIVTPEIQAITDQTHRLYTQGRNFPEGSPERAHYWGQAAVMHQQALEKFLARNEQPAGTTTFAPGEQVVLRNDQTGKVVGLSRDRNRIVVRTRNGLRTVKSGDLRLRSVAPDRKPRIGISTDSVTPTNK